MKSVERPWDWWAYHFRVVHRSQIPGIGRWDDDLVDLIVSVLGLEPGDHVMDLACGSGEHALRLASRGLDVLGVDIAASLIDHCRQRVADRALPARFVVGDMRELAYEEEFDALLLLSGSFGFFDEATNRDVLDRMARALRPGGQMLIDVFDPTKMVVRPSRRSWSSYGNGFHLNHTWWEPETCTYVNEFVFIDDSGVLNTGAQPERIRVYSLPEWQQMFSEVGITMTHALADSKLPLVPYNREHFGNLLIVGSKWNQQG